MHRTIAIFLILIGLAAVGVSRATTDGAEGVTPESSTIVYLVRHAEKVNDGSRDPALSDAGAARARRLARMLSDESIAAVYCTPTTRSRETGRPLTGVAGVEISEYAPMDAAGLAGRIRSERSGERALVVAHSNTVPMILKALGGPEIPELDEAQEYDRLFVVIIDSERKTTTLQLRF